MASTIVRNFIAKALFKKKGAIANNKAVEFSSNALEQRLRRAGIDPNAIQNENQLNEILAAVKQAEDQAFSQRFGDILAGSRFDKHADVLDMTGKKIEPGSKIMGGKQVEKEPINEKFIDFTIQDINKKDPLEGMKIANKIIKREGEFKDLTEAQSQRILKETDDHLTGKDTDYDPEDMAQGGRIGFKSGAYDRNSFEHKINQLKAAYKRYKKGSSTGGRGGIMTFEQFAPLFAAENFATGGRAGYKFGLGPLFNLFNFFNKKSPMKVGKDYLKNIKDKTLKANETGKVMDLPLAEVGIPATTGALITNQLRKKLEAMNEEQKEQFLKEFIEELNADPFYQENPELKDKTIAGYTERLFGEKRADGGRIGYANGTPSFEEYMRERQGMQKKQNFERLYKEYLEELRRKEVREQKQMVAEGGRIGLKAGMTKRAFLKLMGTGAAGIAALKSGLLGLGKGTATKQVVKEVADQGIRSTPPPYFFELANKIKTLGKPDKVTYADRVEIHRYTGKNGDEYELIEDLNTGDMKIQKDKMGGATYGDESFDVIDDRTVLEYRKGEVGVKDEGMDTQKTFKEADEYEEYKVEFDVDGTEADATDLDEIVQKEIIEEATGDAPSIKKAGGGIARMLGE